MISPQVFKRIKNDVALIGCGIWSEVLSDIDFIGPLGYGSMQEVLESKINKKKQ